VSVHKANGCNGLSCRRQHGHQGLQWGRKQP